MTGAIIILSSAVDQIMIAFTALGCGLMISVPLAVISLYSRTIRVFVTLGANLVQAVPSLAVIAIIVPLIGIGMIPAVIAITFRAVLPMVRNTFIGLSAIDTDMLNAGYGIGMSELQILLYIRFPLAFPEIFAGIRFSAILANSMVILTAIIGSGGLGVIVFKGLASMNMITLLSGVIPAVLIAIGMDVLFSRIEHHLTPKGIM